MKSLDNLSTAALSTASAIRALLDTQVQCALATTDDGIPFQHLMAYAFDPQLQYIYVASLRDTKKIENMRKSPVISLLWDNRTGRLQDHVDGIALTASGSASVLAGEDYTIGKAALSARNTTLEPLLQNAGCCIVAIKIKRYRLVQGYSDFQDYVPGK